jgi:anti-sigma regulatory factor (Ser/Thr protein kinase)
MPARRALPMLVGVPELDLPLPRDPQAVAVARVEARRWLDGALDARRLTDLLIVVAELVANAVVHGRGDIRMRLRLDRGNVRGEVVDAGGGFEYRMRAVGPAEVSGRGLMVVDRLTTRWGVHEGTTHVWFEMLAGAAGGPSGPDVGSSRRPPELA